MIFEKSEKLTIISNENLENIVGGGSSKNIAIFKKFPNRKRDEFLYISGLCALTVALTGFGICIANKAAKLFK